MPAYTAPADCRFTQSADGKVKYAQFLYDASEVLFTEGGGNHLSEGVAKESELLVLKIPPVKPNVTVPVLELFLK